MKLKFDALKMRAPLTRTMVEGDPPPAGGGEPPAAPPAGDPKPADETISMPKDAFQARIDQAKRAGLKEAGIDPEQVKKDREELAAMKAKEAERAKAELTDRERLEIEKREAELKAEEATSRADAAVMRANVVEICAKHGIRDIEYAMFRLSKREEGKSIDEFLTEALADDLEKQRYGVIGAAPAGDPKPKDTTNPGGGPAPKPAPGGGPPSKPVSEMTRAEFEAYKAKRHGIS